MPRGSLSKSSSNEVQTDWSKLEGLTKHGVKVIKPTGGKPSTGNQPTTTTAKSPVSPAKDTKPPESKPKDKKRGFAFWRRKGKAKDLPKDEAKEGKDAKKDGAKDKKKESSSSDESDTWGGFKITTIKLDKWTEHTRDEPMFIATKRYLCGDMIGQGSQAKVYEALDTWTLKRRVVKAITKRKEIGFEEERGMNAILMECNILRKLNHPNIIKVFDVFLKLDFSYYELNIVKEYCACTVTEIMDSRPKKRLPIWQCHLYFTQLVEGLDFLHSKGIIHHDIKPDNLLINNDNCLKIIDFGISQQKSMYENDLLSGVSHGTKLYFSPEKFFGLIQMDRYPGDKADLYAAGVTLHVLSCGKHPFFDDDNSATAEIKLKKAIKSGVYQYSSVQEENPGMMKLIKWILTFHPDERPNIGQVKGHPWFQMSFKFEDLAGIPPRDKFGDKYRSMSMTPYLHQLHYPISEKDRAVVVRSESASDLVIRKKRVPYVRSNRLPSPNRSPPDDLIGKERSKSKSPPTLWPQV